jgi:hypothetical protein
VTRGSFFTIAQASIYEETRNKCQILNDKWKMKYLPRLIQTRRSEVIFVIVIVERIFLDQIQFDGIQANNFQLDSAFIAINYFAFIHVGFHVNVGITFWARSGRHFYYLQRRFLSICLTALVLKQSNLTAARPILQYHL